VEKERKSGIYKEATKGIPTKEASTPYKRKSIGSRKKVEEGKRKRDSMCDQTMRSTVRGVEGKSSICSMIESIRALWKRHPK